MNRENEQRIHRGLLEAIFLNFPLFRTKYIILQNSHSFIEKETIFKTRIQEFLIEFLENEKLRNTLISFYKQNINFFSEINKVQIKQLRTEKNNLTNILLVDLLQNTILFQVQRQHYY